MLDTPTVRDWMAPPDLTLKATDSMREVIGRVTRVPFSAIPVIDEADRVVGLLSEKDALRTIGHWTYERVSGGTVGDYMSPLGAQVDPDMDLLMAMCAFLECHFVCLPVIEDGKLVGRLHRHDVLKGLVDWESAIDADRGERMSGESEHERPTAIESMLRAAATHTRDQLLRIFRR
jgi:CBS domain-containing protein